METPDLQDKTAADAVHFGMLLSLTGFAVRRAQLRFYQGLYRELTPAGITPPLFAALVIIGENRGLNQSRLAQALGIARSGAMTIIDRLQGLVERRPVPQDRRRHELVLTEAGQALLAELIPRVEACDREVTCRLEPDDARQLRALLERLV